MKNSKIGILTGGGDVPGLNSIIKSTVYRATAIGRDVIGIRRGFQGLIYMDRSQELDPNWIRRLDRENTRGIDRTGGTILHTSRTPIARLHRSMIPTHLETREVTPWQVDEDHYDLTPLVLQNLARLRIGTLIAIGGDGTLRYSSRLSQEGQQLIAIPKTMDNDVGGTEYCIGFSTAITRAKELITRQRTTLGSHERIGVFRIFGRDAGFTALYTSYVTSTRCLIPEHPFDLEALVEMLRQDRRKNPSNYALVVISEGAAWQGYERKRLDPDDATRRRTVDIGRELAQQITRISGIGTMTSDLTYDLRCGDPDSLDQLTATTFANVAMDLIADGVTGRMVCIRQGRYDHTDIPAPDAASRTLNVEKLYNVDRYRPRYDNKLGAPMLLDVLGG